jgi:hypothetical protein
MASAPRHRSGDDLEASFRDFERALRDYVHERPFTATAAAFATGYVLGGGLTPRLSWIALNAFGRAALINLSRDATVGMRPEAAHRVTH